MRKSILRWNRVLLVLVGLSLMVFSINQPTQAVSTTLVINEIDYDQPSTDNAEFIEIKNVSGSSINLDPYDVYFVNGADNTSYRTINLPDVTLTAGDYYVICGLPANVSNCDLDVSPDTNLMQN